MILCQGELRIERVVNPYGAHTLQVWDTLEARERTLKQDHYWLTRSLIYKERGDGWDI